MVMKMIMIIIAVLAAFARPTWELSPTVNDISEQQSLTSSNDALNVVARSQAQTYKATNGEPFPWNNIRLPKTVTPNTYLIFIHANITDKNVTTFNGRVFMHLKVLQETDFIVFHSKNLIISNLKLVSIQYRDQNKTQSSNITILKKLECLKLQQYYVKFDTIFNISSFVNLEMDFIGYFQDAATKGLYRSSYTTTNGEKRVVASTQFQPSDARSVFPCLDEPELKATFKLSILREPKYITLSNAPLWRTYQYDNTFLVVDEYDRTPFMSTYLVAFAICDFKNISATTRNGTMIRVFAQEDKIRMCDLALNATVTLMQFFTNLFGQRYVLPKLDLICIPNFPAGAMENWGLITFQDSSLLYDPQVSTAAVKLRVVEVIAHEVSHQWFGNSVTMKWWDDIWLNEGFASFVESTFGTDHVDPRFHKKFKDLQLYFSVMNKDSLKSSHPIYNPASDTAEIFALFDLITYYKGSAVIKMLMNFITEGTFLRGLREYLGQYKYRSASTDNLWHTLQRVADLPLNLTISMIMDTWIKQMGFPVVNVTRSRGNIYLSQTRFLQNKDSNATENPKYSNNPYGYKWIIPFTYKTSLKPKVQSLVWLKDLHTDSKLNDSSFKWLKANVNTQGFYLVNYDKRGWEEIIRQLSVDHTVFSVEDKMGLIEDAFTLASADLLDRGIALSLTTYMVNETNYFVWQVALSHLNGIWGSLYEEEEHDQMSDYLLNLLKDRIDAVSWDKQQNPVDELMQTLMISMGISLQYEQVLGKALELFKQWKQGTPLNISNSLRFTVYSQGVMYGTKHDWKFVYQKYTREVVPTERQNYLVAMVYTRDFRLMNLMLKYAFNSSKIQEQDRSSLLTTIGRSGIGHRLAWRYFTKNYDLIFKSYGESFNMGHIISAMIHGMTSEFDFNEVMSFFKGKNLGSGAQSLTAYQERVQNIISSNKKKT